MRPLLLLPLLLSVACSATRHVGPPLVDIPVRRAPPVTVVIEPFFEQARMLSIDVAKTAQVSPPLTSGYYPAAAPQTVTYTEHREEKPLLARVPVLTELHARVMYEVKRRRPEWNVVSTGALSQTTGPVTLVRTIVGDSEIEASNRTMRNMAFGFGLLIPPLLIIAAGPVEETQRVYGMLYRFEATAEQLQPKLIRYPSQPDFAVDTRGLKTTEQRFGLDIMYEEGVFAPENSKDNVLVEGFALQLAGAIIAVAEGYRDTP